MAANDKGYQRNYRMANPDYVKRQKGLERVRRAACKELAEKYPDEYEALYDKYKQLMEEGKL